MNVQCREDDRAELKRLKDEHSQQEVALVGAKAMLEAASTSVEDATTVLDRLAAHDKELAANFKKQVQETSVGALDHDTLKVLLSLFRQRGKSRRGSSSSIRRSSMTFRSVSRSIGRMSRMRRSSVGSRCVCFFHCVRMRMNLSSRMYACA